MNWTVASQSFHAATQPGWGERLRLVRARLGLTQSEMRRIMGAGSNVRAWERGETAMDRKARIQVETCEGVAEIISQRGQLLCR